MSQPVAIAAGSIVACGDALFYVLSRTVERTTLLRIVPGDGNRHRADIEPDGWAGFRGSAVAAVAAGARVRCVTVAWDGATGLSVLGRVSDSFRQRIEAATWRERQVRRFEDTAPLASNLVAGTGSGSRQVPRRGRA